MPRPTKNKLVGFGENEKISFTPKRNEQVGKLSSQIDKEEIRAGEVIAKRREKGISPQEFELLKQALGSTRAAEDAILTKTAIALENMLSAYRRNLQLAKEGSTFVSADDTKKQLLQQMQDRNSYAVADWNRYRKNKSMRNKRLTNASNNSDMGYDDSDEVMPMVYNYDYWEKLNVRENANDALKASLNIFSESPFSYIYDKQAQILRDIIEYNQSDFNIGESNIRYEDIDYTTIPSSILGELGKINDYTPLIIIDEVASGGYIVAEINGTFRDIQGNKSVLAENAANIGAHLYNKENNNDNIKNIVTIVPMDNTEINEEFIDNVNYAYGLLEQFDLEDTEGLYWDQMTEQQQKDWENFVIANPILNQYDYNEIWAPVSDLASDMIYAIYFP